MTTRFYVRIARLVLAAAVVALVGSQSAYAAIYPGNKCVSDKQKEAGKYCKSVLKAWSIWDKTQQDDAKRDGLITKAAGKLASKWTKAEEKAALKEVDCADTTLSSAELALLVDPAAAAIKDAINNGLDLGDKDQAKCGSKLLNAAATKCLKMLLAESKYIKKLEKDPAGLQRDESQTKASTKFSGDWTKFGAGCPTAATEGDIEADVDAIMDEVISQTTVSPNVPDDSFITVSPTGTTNYEGRPLTPTCIYNTDYHFFAKRGSVNKLLMYYQGGGACWEQLTCGLPICDSNVNPAGSDNPNNSFFTGFADLTNPENPFKDWNIVFVSYCSCDVHFGDTEQYYDNYAPGSPLHVWHHGFHNAKVAEKFAREHFVNPEEIFVTGSSAGAYGAIFQAPLLHVVWPYSKFSVLGDAGNGVITQQFLEEEFENWNFSANLPTYIPGLAESMGIGGTGMPGYVESVADYFPATNWAHYTAAFDGGSGGQTGFYNVMLHNNDPGFALNWWKASCAWNGVMRQQAADTYAEVAAANDNYRYYIATGSRHTMWGTDRVYTDTTGDVPVLVDWINDMRTGGPGWVNVQADPYNVLFPGTCIGGDTPGAPCGCDCPGGGTCSGADVRPCPLKAPFELSGDDTIVNCPSPSGAFLDVGESVLD